MLRQGSRGAGAATALLRRGIAAAQLPLLSHGNALHGNAAFQAASSSSSSRDEVAEQLKSGPTGLQKWLHVNAGAAAPGAAAQVVHGGKLFIVMHTEDAAPSMSSLFQQGAAMDWRVQMQPQQQISENTMPLSSVSMGDLSGLFGKIDLDGGVEWEELQAGSVMKKRKKAMNKHKWKKRRKRDRSYAR